MMALAEALVALGETGAAMPFWQHITENHCYPRARVQYAELLIAQNNLDAARKLLREVIDDDPHAPMFQRRRDRVWVSKARSLRRKIGS